MLKVKTIDIDFGAVEVVLNHNDALEFGLNPHDRIRVKGKCGSVVAIVNTSESLVGEGEIGIFTEIAKKICVRNGHKIDYERVGKPESLGAIKKKLDGGKLSPEEIASIVRDIVSKRITLVEMSAFVAGLQAVGMDLDEAEHLTKEMVASGKTINFEAETFDKHSLGGVPGDKTTLIVVPIVAAAGLLIPKTSSRSITSPAGTADRMEVFAPVEHGINSIKKIVNKTNACMVWGGAVDLSPADDALIRVEHPLSLDPRPLLLASIMSKKKSVGSNFVVIDMPTGEGAKIKDKKQARDLARDLIEIGKRLDMTVECAVTYGAQPVGDAMGPALEAREALSTLEGNGTPSVVEKATAIAGIILEAGGVVGKGKGAEKALEILESGKALKKFREIIKAQGGNSDVCVEDIEKLLGKKKKIIKSLRAGYVTKINNKAIGNVAKTAGAPHDKGAGVLLHAKGGTRVKKGDALYTIYAEEDFKLKDAEELALKTKPVLVEGMLLEDIPPTFLGRH
ncbi:MAG: AMP phosphorylase [archaeon]|jgi:AMP phosphorylase|nr:AMP phosphorylase [archaeon]